MARQVKVYEIAWNARIEIDGSMPKLVVEIPRNGYSLTTTAELNVRELIGFIGDVDPAHVLVDGKVPSELLEAIRLVVKALGKAAQAQRSRSQELERLLKIAEANPATACSLAHRLLGDETYNEVCEDYRLRGDELRKVLEKAYEEATQLHRLYTKLQRIANTLLIAMANPHLAENIRVKLGIARKEQLSKT